MRFTLSSADGRVQRAEQVDGDGARGLLAGGGVDVLAELADPRLAVLAGNVAGDEDEVAGAHERHVGGGGRGDRGQRDADGFEAVEDRKVQRPWQRAFGWGANPTLRPHDRSRCRPSPRRLRAGLAGRHGAAAAAGGAVAGAQAMPRCSPARCVAASLAWVLRARGVGFALVLTALALAGFAQTGWRASARIAERLPAALEGRDISVTGVVASAAGARRQRAALSLRRGERAHARRRQGRGAAAGDQRRLVSRGGRQRPADVRAGERWRFTLRLRRPHGTQNPHGFDLELWLFEQGIGASGSVRSAPPAQRLSEPPVGPVDRLRQRVRDAIFAARARPARRRRAGRARGRRPVGDRTRRLGGVPRHRRRPPDEHQRPARDDVRVARRARRRLPLAAQRSGDAAGAGARARRAGVASRSRQRMRCSPAGACRRSARCGCWPS